MFSSHLLWRGVFYVILPCLIAAVLENSGLVGLTSPCASACSRGPVC